MKRILCYGLLTISSLMVANVYAHCGKCAEDTCKHCACKMHTQKEDCDEKTKCTCGKECTCVKAKCPCVKKRCCNRHGKIERHERRAHHEHLTQE